MLQIVLIRTLANQFYEYSKDIKCHSKVTIDRTRNSISLLCQFLEGPEIQDVTNESIRRFFHYGRGERKWQASTFRCNYKCLKVFFDWCVKMRYFSESPMGDIELPRLGKKLPRSLKQQDAERLLEIVYNYPFSSRFLRTRNHAFFATAIFAGLRKSELLNLKYADVDLENKTLLVRQGKGNKDRYIPFHFSLAESLKRYNDERRRLKKTCPEFFCSMYRNGRFTDTGVRRLVDMMRRELGAYFSLHWLRHTFGTLMSEGGVDVFRISAFMGHESINTTKGYLSATAETLRADIRKHPMDTPGKTQSWMFQ